VDPGEGADDEEEVLADVFLAWGVGGDVLL
jgi:hypothetical protein